MYIYRSDTSLKEFIDEQEQDKIPEGDYLANITDIDLSKLSYYIDKDKYIVTYNHSKQFFMKSGEFIGEFKVYPSTLPKSGPCLYIKKGEIIEEMRNKISKTLAKNVMFYGKNQSNSLLGCFVDTVTNMDDELCVNAIVNGEKELFPVSNLFNRIAKMSAVLRSGLIKKSKNDLFWSLTVNEIKIQDVPIDQVPYFKRTEPNVRFLD